MAYRLRVLPSGQTALTQNGRIVRLLWGADGIDATELVWRKQAEGLSRKDVDKALVQFINALGRYGNIEEGV